MSSQRGNVQRTRPQKHQNRKVFKNDLHDTNIRTKRINQTQICNVCEKCRAILEWKIKYKKYKPLKAPKTCNKCHQKTVKKSYHTICSPCAQSLCVCPKCEDLMIHKQEESNLDEDNQFEVEDDILGSSSSDDDSDVYLDGLKEQCSINMSKMSIKT